VQPMVEQYDENKFPSMIIMKGKGKPFACWHRIIKSIEKQIRISQIGEELVYSVDDGVVVFPSQECPTGITTVAEQHNKVDNSNNKQG
jgi:hypothetical protein